MLVVGLMMNSCMTVFTKSHQSITFTGNRGASLYDAQSNVKVGQFDDGGSLTLNLKKKLSDKTFIVKKDGYYNYPITVASEFNSKSLWNILFWPGFLIDLATGKINKYDPVIYNIEMEKKMTEL